MKFFRQSIFTGFFLGWSTSIIISAIAAASWLFILIGLILLSVWILIARSEYKEAKRVGLMTRAEHRTELRHEAELQSIWESK